MLSRLIKQKISLCLYMANFLKFEHIFKYNIVHYVKNIDISFDPTIKRPKMEVSVCPVFYAEFDGNPENCFFE